MFEDEPHIRLVSDPPWVEPMRWLAAELVRRQELGLEQPTVVQIDHFAAFPSELVRRCVLGWSPSGICLDCGEGRRPVVDRPGKTGHDNNEESRNGTRSRSAFDGGAKEWRERTANPDRIIGYACACTPYTDHPGTQEPSSTANANGKQGDRPVDIAAHRRVGPWREWHMDAWSPPPTRPAVVLDPFVGTGTTTTVARALGRYGIGVDLSADYCRLAQWRTFTSGHGAKAVTRTNREAQGAMAFLDT
jgi:hypothetical protein